MKKNVMVSIRTDEADRQNIKRLARSLRVSKSEAMRQAVKNMLESLQAGKAGKSA